MTSKTLMTMAVAGALGLSTAAFAGSGHEVMTPYSPSEAGETRYTLEKIFGASPHTQATGWTSAHASGAVGGPYSDSAAVSGNIDEHASMSMDESLAARDDGVYSEFYTVSFAPVGVESWDYYVLDTAGWDSLALTDPTYVLMPADEIALIPGTSADTIYELALVPATFDGMTAEFESGITDASGE